MKYDEYMDKECIPICDALNELPGVTTFDSCCGHLQRQYVVYLYTDNPYSIAVIARALDRRYLPAKSTWKVTIETIDAERIPQFCIGIYSGEPFKDYDTMMHDVNEVVESINYWRQPELYDHFKKQGEQKPTQETEPFEAEHGKYYYCVKDYFCGGKKQASKGDVVQALRGLPIMHLKDAREYFLPVNFIKCNSAWSEEDENMLQKALSTIRYALLIPADKEDDPCFAGSSTIAWLKSLRGRVQPQQEWSDEDVKMLLHTTILVESCSEQSLINEGQAKYKDIIYWLKSLQQRILKGGEE